MAACSVDFVLTCPCSQISQFLKINLITWNINILHTDINILIHTHIHTHIYLLHSPFYVSYKMWHIGSFLPSSSSLVSDSLLKTPVLKFYFPSDVIRKWWYLQGAESCGRSVGLWELVPQRFWEPSLMGPRPDGTLAWWDLSLMRSWSDRTLAWWDPDLMGPWSDEILASSIFAS